MKTDSLSFALLGASQAVVLVKTGTALPQALSAVFARMDTPQGARGAIQDIAYRTVRRLGRAEALLDRLAASPPNPALLQALLCCALALVSDPPENAGDAPYEVYAVVDQAVTAAAADPALARAKGVVNAILRRFLRERDSLLAAVMQQESARWNYPAWWIAATRKAYPDQWQRILEIGNRMPPLILRVNRRKTTVDAYLLTLRKAGLDAIGLGGDAVRLKQPVPVARIPGFAEGMVSVQDAAAQLAAPLLDLRDGMRVLDACAAPGGKTGHILETADVDLTALDSDPARLTRISDNLQRLQLQAKLVTGDASRQDWWDGQAYDRILADVPCTASGIMRRHPDIRWLRRADDADRLARVSAAILDNLWTMLKPGGKLLFVTCSVWPRESAEQANTFMERNKSSRLDAPGQLLPTETSGNGPEENHDGLFYALFQKNAV